MPFKSEAQRRYLWANEPEIARDWTDTYGSKIHAANGGIMRLALAFGGTGGRAPGVGGDDNSHDRGGKRHQAIAQQAIDTAATRGGDEGRELAIQQYSTNPYGQKTKGFLSGIEDFYNKFGLFPNAWRLGKKLFGTSVEDDNPYSTGRFTMGNPHLEGPIGPTTGPDKGGHGIIPMALPLYNDYYAQNLYDDGVEDEVVEDDFVHRFRVADPYRQNLYKGVEDTPITYT